MDIKWRIFQIIQAWQVKSNKIKASRSKYLIKPVYIKEDSYSKIAKESESLIESGKVRKLLVS